MCGRAVDAQLGSIGREIVEVARGDVAQHLFFQVVVLGRLGQDGKCSEMLSDEDGICCSAIVRARLSDD